MVDAMKKEWQALLIKTEIELEAMANRSLSVVIALAGHSRSATLSHKALEQKVHEEMSEHACHFWRYCRTVALLRAEKWMEAQLTGKPIGPVELPIPYPPLDADLLKLMGGAASLGTKGSVDTCLETLLCAGVDVIGDPPDTIQSGHRCCLEVYVEYIVYKTT